MNCLSVEYVNVFNLDIIMTDKHISFTVSNPTGLTSDRIVGYDFARSMALLGMVIVNYKMVMIDEGPHPEWLLWTVERIE